MLSVDDCTEQVEEKSDSKAHIERVPKLFLNVVKVD